MSQSPAKKIRLDDLLVRRGLAPSKSLARSLIMAGKVRHRDQILDKPGKSVAEDLDFNLAQPPRYVSRGGDKMEAALQAFGLDPKGRTVLDVGASTGGFTDCLLQHGAIASTAIDVGRAQLHPRLQGDPRITNIEKINARHLQPGDLPHPAYDLLVIDVSFISLRLILPPVWPWLGMPGEAILLLKPQFEADKAEVAKGKGIIRDDAIRERIRDQLIEAFNLLPGARVAGCIDCPVHGGDGNREYLLHLQKLPPTRPDVPEDG